MRVMYDGITPSQLPATGQIYASYVDGEWPNFPDLAKLFPGKKYVSIATNVASDAHGLDVERFDASPADAPAWVVRQRTKGNRYPWVYMNETTWPQVKQAFADHVTVEPFYFVANYDGDPTIPPEWRAMGCVAKQWQNTTGYDRSTALDYIPGLDLTMTLTQEDIDAVVNAVWSHEHKFPNGNTYTMEGFIVGTDTRVAAIEAMVTTLVGEEAKETPG